MSLDSAAGVYPLAVYIHVPFCLTRCGYCDFNTYTTGFGRGADRATYIESLAIEIQLRTETELAGGVAREAQSIYFGGGTPALLAPDHIAQAVSLIKTGIGTVPDVEITVEANPDTVTKDSIVALASSGVTRMSFGVQSTAVPVLQTLERTHTPQQVPRVLEWARDAGLQTSVDLIYGTPGEELPDLLGSLRDMVALQPDHISAYALAIHDGTALGRRVRAGSLPAIDDDWQATCYRVIDDELGSAGYQWYEISNWARKEQYRCRHNSAYWLGWDWWGAGPGAHSHAGERRYWNEKHPRRWADRLLAGELPVNGTETLTAAESELERVMLQLRMSSGVSAVAGSIPQWNERLAELVDNGMCDPQAASETPPRAVLTLKGRLLADAVTRALTA
ncbi:MAG: radical SAM family heme chaperone HemW [Varibaculum sp.]|nr:radical SAM family heme chaperone HemW [Varibaculum sp.]